MDIGVLRKSLEDLKVVFLLHFIFTTWAVGGNLGRDIYLYYNMIFLVILLWGIHTKDSAEPIIMALYVNSLSIVFDILIILIYFPPVIEFLYTLNAIFNLVLRFFTVISLSSICRERNGTVPSFLTNILGTSAESGQHSYEDIDRSVPHQSVPQTEVRDPFAPKTQFRP